MSDDGVSAILLLFKWEKDDTSLTKLGMPQTHRSYDQVQSKSSHPRRLSQHLAVEHPDNIRIDLAENAIIHQPEHILIHWFIIQENDDL
jgi:hypothetical protein